ncbi:hypothetical protein [Pseudomonas shirazensis]
MPGFGAKDCNGQREKAPKKQYQTEKDTTKNYEYIEGNILEIAYSTFIPRDEENNAIDHHSIDEL